jgi:hypothetical protein
MRAKLKETLLTAITLISFTIAANNYVYQKKSGESTKPM